MVFSSPLFLFLFLPVVLSLYPLLPGIRAKNGWLLLVSLVFYAWGEPGFILLLLGSTVANFYLGRWVDRQTGRAGRKVAVAVAVALNLGLLAFFKYADFTVASWNTFAPFLSGRSFSLPGIPLPVGISFFTFHALSYVIDIYRGKWRAADTPLDTALYIFFFPQLIAGPILRWSAIAPQLAGRSVSRELFAEGIRRFVGGLGKKMIIANVVGAPADQIFALAANERGAAVAWFGILCYTLQIYFDFSGYSDMAVGLGKMFGFRFLENFEFPYISQSIKEFWRRWHISLSSWFRDYLYIPLGGSRVSPQRTYGNLLLVFFLCGLWHGASWTFAAWGLYHGLFLVLERTPFGRLLSALPRPLRHLYALVVIMVGWVLFRADSFPQAMAYLQTMVSFDHFASAHPLARYLSRQVATSVGLGLLFSMPFWHWLQALKAQIPLRVPIPLRHIFQGLGLAGETMLICFVFVVSLAWLSSATFNPFIYFRF